MGVKKTGGNGPKFVGGRDLDYLFFKRKGRSVTTRCVATNIRGGEEGKQQWKGGVESIFNDGGEGSSSNQRWKTIVVKELT